MAELRAAQEAADTINREERLFGWAASKYGHIATMTAALEPYHMLWTTTFEFFDKSSKWLNQPFKEVSAEEVEELVGEMARKVYKLIKTFSGAGGNAEQEAPLKVAAEVRCMLAPPPPRRGVLPGHGDGTARPAWVACGAKDCAHSFSGNRGKRPIKVSKALSMVCVQTKDKIAAFQQYIPLMHAVCNPGLRPRHWDVISDETGVEVSGESTASIKYLIDSEFMDFLPRIVEVSDTASREWSIEKALAKMLGDWAELEFELAEWKETGARWCQSAAAQKLLVLLLLLHVGCFMQRVVRMQCVHARCAHPIA